MGRAAEMGNTLDICRDLTVLEKGQIRKARLRITGFDGDGRLPGVPACTISFEGVDIPTHTVWGGDEIQALGFALHAVCETLAGQQLLGVDVYDLRQGDLGGLRGLFDTEFRQKEIDTGTEG